MASYLIQTEEMTRIIELLHNVLKIRIAFFDLQGEELRELNLHAHGTYCLTRRRDASFDARCIQCDRRNLTLAKEKREVRIYHCHAGLLEGIVPLYDRNDTYLGAIVFGQVMDEEEPVRPSCAGDGILLAGMRSSSSKEMRQIGELLKYLSEYICENELIRRKSQPWGELLREHIAAHLDRRFSLREIAALLGKSVSFLSHGIPQELGMPLTRYVRMQRMEKAMKMLREHALVKECAYALGYQDEFYFSRDFKKYHGFPPGAVKRLERQS